MYDEISICVNDIVKHPEALIAASKFAQRFGANLNSCYLKLDAADIWRWQSGNPMELAQQFLADEDAREDLIRANFNTLTKKYPCHSTWNTFSKSSDPLKRMICSDIIVANQPQKSDTGFIGSLAYINRLIMQSHRPIMVIPHNWTGPSIGSRVVLGWNSSPEAMRATSDAMPILQSAEIVMVVDIVKEHLLQVNEDQSPAIENYLSSKSVAHQVTVMHADSGYNGELAVLPRFAEENNADLIVIGGYGHSRVRELLMGGMTKHLIEKSRIPVFISH